MLLRNTQTQTENLVIIDAKAMEQADLNAGADTWTGGEIRCKEERRQLGAGALKKRS